MIRRREPACSGVRVESCAAPFDGSVPSASQQAIELWDCGDGVDRVERIGERIERAVERRRHVRGTREDRRHIS